MPRSILFVDLAGTLILRDPEIRRWVAWTGVAGLLHSLAARHDLHLTTGDSTAGARAALDSLEVRELFAGLHTNLPGGGKPFGALARTLGARPEQCLALGDSPVSDTAGDSDRVVSVILEHHAAQVPVARVSQVVDALAGEAGFLAGFEAALAADPTAGAAGEPAPGPLHAAPLVPFGSIPDARLGWWRRSATQRRPVVVLTA
ncbi:MAG: HAD family hydrolase [Candidatus Krumholzibacteriia bacterium]